MFLKCGHTIVKTTQLLKCTDKSSVNVTENLKSWTLLIIEEKNLNFPSNYRPIKCLSSLK